MEFGLLNEKNTQLLEEKENKRNSITHHVNGLKQSLNKSDGFVVDIEGLSQILEKKGVNGNSRITRNFSRNSSDRALRDSNLPVTSPKATLQGISFGTLEKPTVMESSDEHLIVVKTPQIQTHHNHHQISITNCSKTNTSSKRSNLRRPWIIIGPRRILLFFATLSCMGTILLIYFTLSMGQVNGN